MGFMDDMKSVQYCDRCEVALKGFKNMHKIELKSGTYCNKCGEIIRKENFNKNAKRQ